MLLLMWVLLLMILQSAPDKAGRFLHINARRVLGVFSLEKRRLGGDLITPDKSLEGGCSQVWADLFFYTTRRRHSLKMHQGRLTLNIRNNFCMERVVKHWNGLPREVVESLFLEMINK